MVEGEHVEAAWGLHRLIHFLDCAALANLVLAACWRVSPDSFGPDSRGS